LQQLSSQVVGASFFWLKAVRLSSSALAMRAGAGFSVVGQLLGLHDSPRWVMDGDNVIGDRSSRS